jgi:hypothetical protein
MHFVKMVFRGQGKYREIIVGDSAGTGYLVRNLVGRVLATLYKQAIIDHTAVQFLPYVAISEGDYCIVHIQARCLGKQWPQYDKQAMEVEIEAELALPLVQLFGSVTIEVISVCDVP